VKLLRKILIPIVPIYQGITWLRNYGYDHNFLKSKSYDLPVICVGNLNVGGTGKTPMIECLIRLLQNDYKVGTLSRGYGRQTKGFILANEKSTAQTIGDEPFQFYNKFPDVIVSVGEDRQNAIEQLLQLKLSPEIILLDDAFQHRKVKAGFNILLTSYDSLYVNDMLLPTGNLREPKSGAKRADIIIVTKCPTSLSSEAKNRIESKLNVEPDQQLFFSSISYSDSVISKDKTIDLQDLKGQHITLVTGIANPKPLVKYLEGKALEFKHESYKDHHNFTVSEINELREQDLILTTEKDYVRLKDNIESDKLYYLPIEAKILSNTKFNSIIESFVKSF